MTNIGTATWPAQLVSADLDALAREQVKRGDFRTIGNYVEFCVRSQLMRDWIARERAAGRLPAEAAA